MEVYFSWESINGEVEPVCRSDNETEGVIDIVGCLLMDDGGLGYAKSVSWLDEGLRAVAAVKSGEADSQDWSRETWGAYLCGEKAEIYSLEDESFKRDIDIDRFQRILGAWRNFVVAVPRLGSRTEIFEY
ncbi:hypothetical protein NHH88_20085 [Oxalobacteraceae bacterium OTU3CAMAD1]|nr:hypothetical protein NHH88_20085 [Oxalobacteraceae bacterium OTU3CAMAD1]